MTSQTAVDGFLAQPALALVGMSRSGRSFGNYAYNALTTKGYRVYPIHPIADTIDGHPCYHRFADLPEHVDAVLIVVPPEQAANVVKEAAAAGVHHVWLQQGAESPQVLAACRDAGVDAVAGECILMFAKPTGFHKMHRWAWKLAGKLPA
jgi:predicted CoA-binding protein